MLTWVRLERGSTLYDASLMPPGLPVPPLSEMCPLASLGHPWDQVLKNCRKTPIFQYMSKRFRDGGTGNPITPAQSKSIFAYNFHCRFQALWYPLDTLEAISTILGPFWYPREPLWQPLDTPWRPSWDRVEDLHQNPRFFWLRIGIFSAPWVSRDRFHNLNMF